MRMRVRTRDFEPGPDPRKAVERAIRLELGRRASGVERAFVALRREEGPGARGSVRCGLRVTLRDGRCVAVVDRDPEADRAAAAAARRVARRLDCLGLVGLGLVGRGSVGLGRVGLGSVGSGSGSVGPGCDGLGLDGDGRRPVDGRPRVSSGRVRSAAPSPSRSTPRSGG